LKTISQPAEVKVCVLFALGFPVLISVLITPQECSQVLTTSAREADPVTYQHFINKVINIGLCLCQQVINIGRVLGG
jgi:hypothetical protein